ncbi:hypothetical protein ACKWTF_005835 [Chironomus riparius]
MHYNLQEVVEQEKHIICSFHKEKVHQQKNFWYFNQARSLDVELTRDDSLALILKIVQYLVSKANNFGGYSSSQDTVMLFYALSQFAKTYSSDANVELILTPNAGKAFKASVDSSNIFKLQSFDLNTSTRQMKIAAMTDDSGLAIVSLICNFYEDPTKVVPAFNVTHQFESSCTHRMTFKACATYIPKGTSNMAIMIVNLPSGFVYIDEPNQRNYDVSQTEVANQGSKFTFYFEKISNQSICVTAKAFRSEFVAELKVSTIEVYDYYDTSEQGMTSYPAPDLSSPCSRSE